MMLKTGLIWLNVRTCTVRAVAAVVALLGAVSIAGAADCGDIGSNPSKLGVSRIVEIDTSTGAVIGKFTTLPHEANFLAPDEVVLTFDDGPMPWITRSILATLEQHCTRATFFSVGKMALAYPTVLREVLDHGHTVGTHTWSHPLNLKRLSTDGARDEIERGFAAVATAAGRPIAPFFRFPGLSDSPSMVAYLAERHVASFTVDVVSNDSYIADPNRLARETLAKVDANHGGIILFHDIKAATAKALPVILDALAQRGYSIVHMVPKDTAHPRPDMMAAYAAQVDRLLAQKAEGQRAQLPFFGSTGPIPVARLPSRAQSIVTQSLPATAASVAPVRKVGQDTGAKKANDHESVEISDDAGGWSTSLHRNPSR